MSQKEAKEEREKQRRHQLHAGNLQNSQADNNVKALAQLSEIDVPIDDSAGDVLETWTSKVNSTAKLSEEKRVSHEWEREISMTLWVSSRPTVDGMHGSWQGWAYGNSQRAKEPLDPDTRMQVEAGLQTSNVALTRSDGGFAIKESLRGIKQSFVGENDDGGSGGGILGRLGLK